jgi:hypothetical protein
MKSTRGYEWSLVILRITGKYLDPAEVTEALGIEPDDSAKKGDLYGLKRNRVCEQGVWSLIGGPPKVTMDAQIMSILKRTRPVKSRLRKLIRENRHVKEAHLDIGYGPPEEYEISSYVLKSQAISELTSLGIDIEISAYIHFDRTQGKPARATHSTMQTSVRPRHSRR